MFVKYCQPNTRILLEVLLYFVTFNCCCVSICSGMISVVSVNANNKTVYTIRDRTLVRTETVIQGYIVLSNPSDACRPVKPPPITGRKSLCRLKQWILLATLDDSCSIGQKAENARKAGYSALIIKNVGTNDTGHWLPSVSNLGSSRANTNIYSGVVGQFDGDLLQKNFTISNGYFIRIHFEAPWKTVYYFVLYGCLFIGLVFFCWGLRMFVFNLCIPRTYPGLVERYNALEQTITQRIVIFRLQRLPTQKWTNFTGHFEICAICLEEFVTDESIRILHCSHVFHTSCLDHWLICERHRCPICISNVFVKKKPTSNPKAFSFYGEREQPLLLLPVPSSSVNIANVHSYNVQPNT